MKIMSTHKEQKSCWHVLKVWMRLQNNKFESTDFRSISTEYVRISVKRDPYSITDDIKIHQWSKKHLSMRRSMSQNTIQNSCTDRGLQIYTNTDVGKTRDPYEFENLFFDDEGTQTQDLRLEQKNIMKGSLVDVYFKDTIYQDRLCKYW